MLNRKQSPPFSLLRWTGTSLLMLLLSSSVDSLRTRVGSFWASQSATLLSDAIIAACSVLKSLPPAPPLPAPLFLERDLWWSGVNFDTWSLMVTFPGEVLSNSMVKEAWPWAVEQTLQFYCVSQRQSVNTTKPSGARWSTFLKKMDVLLSLICILIWSTQLMVSVVEWLLLCAEQTVAISFFCVVY